MALGIVARWFRRKTLTSLPGVAYTGESVKSPLSSRPVAHARHLLSMKTDISTVASPIAGFRFDDLRHHAITELATPAMSPKNAVANLSKDSESKSQVTIDVTKRPRTRAKRLQVIENMVDVRGLEPLTPCLQSRCSPS